MVWRAKWGETKLEKYPYRPNTGQKVSGHTDMITTLTHQPDYARRAAAGWAQHQSDQAHRQAVLRDPGYQKWQQARGLAIEDDEDWYPKEDWNSSQNNHFGYLYSKDPWEARNYATLVNRENRWGKEIGSQQVRTGMPKKPNFLDRAADFLTDAWNRNAEAESVNSGLAMEQGLKTGEKARKVFDSAGQAMAAQSEMNRQGADGAAKEIKEQTKKAVNTGAMPMQPIPKLRLSRPTKRESLLSVQNSTGKMPIRAIPRRIMNTHRELENRLPKHPENMAKCGH